MQLVFLQLSNVFKPSVNVSRISFTLAHLYITECGYLHIFIPALFYMDEHPFLLTPTVLRIILVYSPTKLSGDKDAQGIYSILYIRLSWPNVCPRILICPFCASQRCTDINMFLYSKAYIRVQ
jgi:hypothetical protein